MFKFTSAEKETVKSVVARLSVKRISDIEIISEVYHLTGKTVTTKTIWNVRQQIKKESYYWYQRLREGNYEYIHEFKEKIREMESLMKKHHEIIDDNQHNPQIHQTSLAELHKLNITFANYFDVAPPIVGAYTTSNLYIKLIPLSQLKRPVLTLIMFYLSFGSYCGHWRN